MPSQFSVEQLLELSNLLGHRVEVRVTARPVEAENAATVAATVGIFLPPFLFVGPY